MTQMHSGNDIAGTAPSAARDVIGLAAGPAALRDGATSALLAPSVGNASGGNGCISEISSDAIRGRAQDYAAAMKSYGVTYEAYHAYLLPAEQTPLHDYDMAAQPVPDFSRLGCLNADFFDAVARDGAVSDDDIESCGYMAWVHH